MLSFDLTPEQQQLKETARRFAADEIMPVAGQCDEEQRFPLDVCKKQGDGAGGKRAHARAATSFISCAREEQSSLE